MRGNLPLEQSVMPRFIVAVAVAALAVLVGGLAPAQAGIVVTVDKSAQSLSVMVDGAPRYQWPVSTARMGYRTPNGSYRPQRLERKWFSRKYNWSPMPYSIFFNEGYAIHGSYEISHLGRPASHGCIRLHPQNAELLFALVKERVGDTTIVVTGDRQEQVARSRARQEVRYQEDRQQAERHEKHRVQHEARRVRPEPQRIQYESRRIPRAHPVDRAVEAAPPQTSFSARGSWHDEPTFQSPRGFGSR
jgi:L,D-transpeptidase catalytic domain